MSEKFLEDFSPLEYQLTENEDKRFVIRGVFSKADVPNKNGRVYPFAILKEMVESVQDLISRNGLVGELDHPPSPKINVDKISHKITRLELMEDGAVVGEMEVLNTDQGRKLRQLMSEGIHLGVSTRALGNTRPYNGQLGKNLVEVTSGLRLKAIDVVFDPSAGDFGRPEFVMEGENFDYLDKKETNLTDMIKGIF